MVAEEFILDTALPETGKKDRADNQSQKNKVHNTFKTNRNIAGGLLQLFVVFELFAVQVAVKQEVNNQEHTDRKSGHFP